MVKCGEYFPDGDRPREFGNISVNPKWVKTTDTSLVLRNLEVNYKKVKKKILHPFATVLNLGHVSPKARTVWRCDTDRGSSANVRVAYPVSGMA